MKGGFFGFVLTELKSHHKPLVVICCAFVFLCLKLIVRYFENPLVI